MNTITHNNLNIFTFMLTMLSFFPATLLTTVLWYLQWRFHLLGSFAIALFPMFISNAMFIFSCITPYIFRHFILFQNPFLDFMETLFMGLAGCCFISPLFVFEVLLIYHMDKMKFLWVIVFIPLWLFLCVLGCGGCFTTCTVISDNEWTLKQLPHLGDADLI
jgi:hypothetical protein